ncbi:MAG TPA: VOC family protein [Solirubrobacteraceae bacterium]|nr:VOC family protein [Solirubrobacteraceae bacterium]
MTRFDHYPAGVPCFVETFSPDLDAARRFYDGIFGWKFDGPGQMPTDPPGQYWVARARGAEVAGIGSLPTPDTPIAWNTQVAVDDVDASTRLARDAGATVIVEPIDAPPAGRLAVVADPAGAAITLWQAGVRQGAAIVNEPSAWAMSLLATPEPERAAAFYRDVFGWRTEPFADAGPGVSLFRLPGYVGGEAEQPVPRDVVAAMAAVPDPNAPAAWSVDFWIADADAAADAAPGLGGSVVAPPHDAPPFRRAVLAAPDGATFTVSQLRPWAGP